MAGLALLGASLVWGAAALGAVPPRYVTLTGVAAVILALGVSFLYLRTL